MVESQHMVEFQNMKRLLIPSTLACPNGRKYIGMRLLHVRKLSEPPPVLPRYILRRYHHA